MTLIVAIVGLAMLVTTADAKEEAEAFVVCGAERCREFGGEVVKLASTLTTHRGRRPRRVAPFYDVYFVVREANEGRPRPGGTLRYVPSAWAVRSQTASGHAIWFRAERRLALTLIEGLDGLAPRPASALDAPALDIGAATATSQQALAGRRRAAAAPTAGDGNRGPLELRWIAAFGAVAGFALLRELRRRRRESRQTSVPM